MRWDGAVHLEREPTLVEEQGLICASILVVLVVFTAFNGLLARWWILSTVKADPNESKMARENPIRIVQSLAQLKRGIN